MEAVSRGARSHLTSASQVGFMIAELLEREQVRGVLGAAELIRGGLMDRNGDGAGGAIAARAGMQDRGFRVFAVHIRLSGCSVLLRNKRAFGRAEASAARAAARPSSAAAMWRLISAHTSPACVSGPICAAPATTVSRAAGSNCDSDSAIRRLGNSAFSPRRISTGALSAR